MDTQKAIEYFSGKLERTLSNRRRQAYEVALEALEKQVPKKAIEHETKFAPVYECPSCGCIDVYGQENCDECGQKIKWEVEDNAKEI